MTGTDLIRRALRLIGQLGPGRTANTSETADAQAVLNAMLEAWGIDQLLVYHFRVDTLALTGAASYTVGSGGDFDVPRPVAIDTAYAIDAAGSRTELEILAEDKWRRGDTGLFYDANHPLGTIYLTLPAGAAQLELTSRAVLDKVTDLAAALAFPPGYEDAIAYNLAVKLAPEWGKQLRADVLQLAISSRAAIERANLRPLTMECDSGLPRPRGIA